MVNIYNYKDERVICIFAVNDEVKYIGVCDTTTLENRMNRYKVLQGVGTNERIANIIRDCLEQGDNVKIYAIK
ncbi:unnamed protein product [marine sediment metagenome]|uniref:GIY-YIG domain-containing protein n=1 Tax=marine sediment metagenome TaxID=412755 RepID=X1F7H9_9ZZZZ